MDRLSIGFQAVKSIQISTISGPSETALPHPADEPAPRRAQDVPGAAPEHLIPRAAAPEAVSFRPPFFVKTGISRGPWKTPARDFFVWKSPSLGPNAARLTSGDYLASIQTIFLFILQTHTPMLDLTRRRRRPQMAAACCPEVYLAWATDVRLRGNGCAGSSFESHYNWLWASGRFAAF